MPSVTATTLSHPHRAGNALPGVADVRAGIGRNARADQWTGGYTRRGDATHRLVVPERRVAFLPGRWHRTGDLGILDADGYLTVTDRLKDIIIRGGENISSKEIEDLLSDHPAVAEAAVVAASDPVMGERVRAVVMARAGHSFDVAEARRYFARVGVARQKTPEVVLLIDELPRTPAGKVQKFVLRTLTAQEPDGS